METVGKILLVLDRDVKRELEALIPSGQRSRIINEALRKELLLIKRKKITEELLEISSHTRSVSTKEIVKELRKERRRH